MPLPSALPPGVAIHMHDGDGIERPMLLKQRGQAAPAPTQEYHPTHVMAACSLCGMISVVECAGGFNLKLGDRLMDKKPIPIKCYRCNRRSEAIPVTDEQAKAHGLKDLKDSIEAAAARGERFTARSVVTPLAVVEAYDKFIRKRNGGIVNG